jgi:hypothetical protein
MTTATENFWNWFKTNNKLYLRLDDVDEDVKEHLLDDLQDHLHQYNDRLYFQIGGLLGKNQELIVTAEGDASFFEEVEALIKSAPTIDNWKFIAFVQPQDGLNVINFEDVELSPQDMWFMPLKNANNPVSIGIRVCMPNYDLVVGSKWFKAAVYKVLDTLLGEKSFALDIDHIDFGKLPEKPEEENMIELTELSAYVKWRKSKHVN